MSSVIVRFGFSQSARLEWCAFLLGLDRLDSSKKLTSGQAAALMRILCGRPVRARRLTGSCSPAAPGARNAGHSRSRSCACRTVVFRPTRCITAAY